MTPERERLVRAVKVAERHLDDMIAAEDGDAESNAWVCLDIAERALAAYDAAHPTVMHCSGDLTLQPDHDEEHK